MRTHSPAPEDAGPYDTCQHCGQAIVQHWDNRELWVTMAGGNAECYGKGR
jgi:hypothetical protein